MNNLDTCLGENVRKSRKKRNVTQEKLALNAGIDRSYMSRIERGIVSITVQKAYLIADAIGCDITELLPTKDQLK